MVGHCYGDSWDGWDDLNKAVDYVYDFCWKWGRFSGQAKEKYGTLRFYNHFGLSLYQLIAPRECYFYRDWYPKWLLHLDLDYISPVLVKLFGWIWFPYQHWIYRQAHANAIRRWPNVRAEILGSPDYPELLKGL